MRLLRILVLALACACDVSGVEPGGSLQPLVDASVDASDRDVVALLFRGSLRCTGTLIAPRVVLTAAHCVTSPLPDQIFIGGSLEELEPATAISVVETVMHPAFDLEGLVNDVALLLLERPVPDGIAIRSLAARPLGRPDIGVGVRLVGFGVTLSAADLALPRKHQGTARIGGLGETDFTILPDPTGACSGDSGGPVLMEIAGVESVVGVISAGDHECDRYGRITRVDIQVDDFILPRVDAAGAPIVPLGEPCFWQDDCGTALCARPIDSERATTCLRSCTEDRSDSCPHDLLCRAVGDGAFGCASGLPAELEIVGGCRAASVHGPSSTLPALLLLAAGCLSRRRALRA